MCNLSKRAEKKHQGRTVPRCKRVEEEKMRRFLVWATHDSIMMEYKIDMLSLMFDERLRKRIFNEYLDILSDKTSSMLGREAFLGKKPDNIFGKGEEDPLFFEPFFESVKLEGCNGLESALIEWSKHQCFSDARQKFWSDRLFEVSEYSMLNTLELCRYIFCAEVFFESDGRSRGKGSRTDIGSN